jgi:hypothetical protein
LEAGLSNSTAIGDNASTCEAGGFVMAKGQQRQPKEKKKPKAAGDKPKAVSAYKQGYGGGSASTTTGSLGAKKP